MPARLPALTLLGCCPHTQDDREKKWRIQAVGVAPGSFDSRKALPVAWRGLRDAELRWAGGLASRPQAAPCNVPGLGIRLHGK